MSIKKSQNVKAENLSNFGIRLKEAFGEASQTEIAQQLELSNSAISNYIEGRIPPADTLTKIASITSYSIHWLITGEGPKKVLEPRLSRKAHSRTLMLINEKGGSAKSTSAVMLSVELTRRGYQTLLIDSSAGNCTSALLGPELPKLIFKSYSSTEKPIKSFSKKRMFFKTEIPRLHLCLSNKRALSVLAGQGTKGFNMKPEAIRREYDFVIMDTDPSTRIFETLNPFTAALIESAYLLIPVFAQPLSLPSLEGTLRQMENALQTNSDIKFLGAFLTVFFSNRKTSLMMIDELNKLLPGKLLNTVIRENKEIAGLSSYNPRHLLRPSSQASAQYSPLADEILSLLGEGT